jgi:hypothetical protein
MLNKKLSIIAGTLKKMDTHSGVLRQSLMLLWFRGFEWRIFAFDSIEYRG